MNMSSAGTRTRVALSVVAGVLVVLGFGTLLARSNPQGQLMRACDGATRVLVDLNVFGDRLHDDAFRKFDIRDPKAVRALVDAIQVERREQEVCGCRGDMVLRFLRDDHELACFTLFHGDQLAWWNGPWPGRKALTKTSAPAVQAWLKRNACPSSDEAFADQARALEAWQAGQQGRSTSAATMPEAETPGEP